MGTRQPTTRPQAVCGWDRESWAIAMHGWRSWQHDDALMEPGTCLLPYGHEGPHVFTPDHEIQPEEDATDE